MSDHDNNELDDEQAELVRRYGLGAEDVKRVRGDSWAEMCADAERLANLAEPQSIRERARRHLQAMQDNPNAAELAAFAVHDNKAVWGKEFVEALHSPTEDDGDKDGGDE